MLGVEFNIKQQGVHISCPQYITNCAKLYDIYNHINTFLPLQPGVFTSLQEKPKTEAEKEAMKDVPYRNLLGSLLYVSGRCRPDVTFPTISLSQVAENPAFIHWKRLMQVLKYLNSTKELGIWMPKNSSNIIQLVTYCDASWASDPETRRSWTGYSIFLNQAPIIWRAKKQTCIAVSPMEAEFIAASEAAKDTKYLNSTITYLIKSLDLEDSPILIQKPLMFCDNTATVQYCKHQAENVKNRHIDLKYKFVRELIENDHLDVKHVSTNENLADLLTKGLNKEVFIPLRTSYVSAIPKDSSL